MLSVESCQNAHHGDGVGLRNVGWTEPPNAAITPRSFNYVAVIMIYLLWNKHRGLNLDLSVKGTSTHWKLSSAYCGTPCSAELWQFYVSDKRTASFKISNLLRPEDRRSLLLRTLSAFSPQYMPSRRTKQHSSNSPLWDPQIHVVVVIIIY